MNDTQRHSGALVVGGATATELAQTYGTPLLVIDTDVFDAAIAHFAAIAAELDLEIAYAAKALFFVALARRLARSPLSVDVRSLGELLTAERAAFPAERLVLHGCGKTDAELDAALAGRVGRIVVDGLEELERLRARSDARRPADVVLRVNTGVAAPTHAAVRTAGDDTKFGFAREAFTKALAIVRAEPGLRLAGVHAHVGSQIFDRGVFVQHVRGALDFYAQAAAPSAAAPQSAQPLHLIAGGGFGVATQPGQSDLDVAATLRELAATVRGRCAALNLPGPRLGAEPGRALIARAGTSLYRVLAVKDQGRRRFAVVDGGIADNPRPALYGAYHHPVLAGRTSSAPATDTTLCGRSCENDELVPGAALPGDLAPADLLALESTGAYTFSMASNYNRFGRPAVVFAGGGQHRLVVRRESAGDVLRNDVVADV